MLDLEAISFGCFCGSLGFTIGYFVRPKAVVKQTQTQTGGPKLREIDPKGAESQAHYMAVAVLAWRGVALDFARRARDSGNKFGKDVPVERLIDLEFNIKAKELGSTGGAKLRFES